jgi:hypothetical protein
MDCGMKNDVKNDANERIASALNNNKSFCVVAKALL